MDENLIEGEEQTRSNERIIKLNSEKKAAEVAAAEANTKAEEAEAKTAALEREIAFVNSFTESSAKYPGATEYRDAIKGKVFAGYSVEDATVSVLNKEGKLVAAIPKVEIAPAAGGSAVNQLPDGGTKTLQEMTREEKRAQLVEAEKRGDIFLT